MTRTTKRIQMKLSDYKRGSKIKALVFGRHKSGKTTGAATFPRSILIECDPDGFVPLTKPELEAKYGFSKNVVDYKQFFERDRNSRGVVATHNAYDDVCRYFDEWTAAGKIDQWDTLILDSATTLSEFARNKGIILLGGTSMSPKPLSFTQKNALNTGMVLPKLQDFGAERSLVEQFIDMVLALDKNVLILCHEKEIWEGDPPDERLTAVTPLFTGQSAERVPLKFSEVWYLGKRRVGTEWRRVLQTESDGLHNCSTGLGVANETPFEYQAIINSIGGNK
jgi:hypothetical protein